MTGEGEERAAVAGPRVGEALRQARENEGMALEEVAQRTRVPIRHLRMIEDGDYAGLPAATYAAGFVKSYARLLGLDAAALSDRFRAEIERETVRPHRPEPFELADPRRTPPWGVAALALLVALVLGVGFLYWRGTRDQPAALAARGVDVPAAGANPRPVAPATAAAGPAALTSASAPTPAAVPNGRAVVIGANQEVWVKVSAGGRTLFMGTLKPGTSFPVPADAVDPRLTTGRPGNTLVTVGGAAVPPVGDPDRAAHDVSLRPEALLARAAPGAPSAAAPAG